MTFFLEMVVVEDDLQAAKVREERHRLSELETVIVMVPGPEGVQSGERTLAEVVDQGHRRLIRENGLGRGYKERSQALDPDALAAYKLSPSAVLAAIREQNAQTAGGSIGAQPLAGGRRAVVK